MKTQPLFSFGKRASLRAAARRSLPWLAACALLAAQAGISARAGDLLRSGFNAPKSASSIGTEPPATAVQERSNALDILARTTQALNAVQAMQNAARGLAAGKNNLGMDPNHPGMQLPNVPNGLATGGLQPAGVSGALWQGANAPVQSSANGQTAVTVKQTAQQALLTWTTFNVGRNTSLNFDQSAGGSNVGQWIAFNKITDPSGSPSQILGSINAPGQVYVINQNGIIFGGASQINVHTLVASSLPINDNLVSAGLLNNPDLQFLFSQLALPAGSVTPAFNPPAPNTPNGRDGDVTVQPGAVIQSPASADNVGGRVALVGPNVTNAGTIYTPDGQTILAAGNQVGFAAHATTDPSLRGLDVQIGSVDAYSGAATNSGLIEAPEADVTMAGKSVNQLGVIDSQTSVSLNGRIDLLANYDTEVTQALGGGASLTPSAAGSVTLGPGSVTQILPDWASSDRVVGTSLALPSVVDIQGETVHFESNSILLAPSAGVPTGADATGDVSQLGIALQSGVTVNAGNWLPDSTTFAFALSGGQIYMDAGADINVAGSTDVTAPMSENIVAVQLRGAQLSDSPLQRDSTLRGQTIDVDIRDIGVYDGQAWVGTPLADTSGYIGLIERTAGELTTAGGSVSLNAGGSVVTQAGAVVDVSGGYISYQSGIIQTTRVISGGFIYDISQATPNLVYDGIYTGQFTAVHPKWGILNTFTNPLVPLGAHFEQGYIQGGAGGSISIAAPSMALDGDLFGSTSEGPRQITAESALAAELGSYSALATVEGVLGMPAPSSLTLSFEAQAPLSVYNFPEYSPTPPEFILENGHQTPAAAFAVDASGNPLPLSAERQAVAVFSPETAANFGSFTVNDGDGNIVIPYGTTLASPTGGSIAFFAANISDDGRITVPGGSVSFTVYDNSPFKVDSTGALQPGQTFDPGRGQFDLGADASLSVAGPIVDNRLSSPTANTLPLITQGGSVSIDSISADLAAGSVIDVSGGLAIGATGKLTYGNGGSITITTGQDPEAPAVLGGKFVLQSTLEGYSGSKGGSLNIQAELAQIGGAASNPNTLLLQPEFFTEGGFSSYSISGLGLPIEGVDGFVPAVVIAQNTVIDPVTQTLVALPNHDGGFTLTPMLLPEGQRSPVSVSFGAPGVTDPSSGTTVVRGEIFMDQGSVIHTDALASVSLDGQTVTIMGTIIAPGGTITVKGGSTFADYIAPSEPLPTVDIGPTAFLSTAGMTLLTPNVHGYRTGSVLNGGSILISGNVVAEAGSVLDVSGASNQLDLPPSFGGTGPDTSLLGLPYVRTEVASNGGSITLSGAQELFSDATLRGAGGGPSAQGGSLSVSSGLFVAPGSATILTPLDPTIELTQSSPAILHNGGSVIGNPILDANGNILTGMGYFGANEFNSSGLDSLDLHGTVEFSGPVSITAHQSLVIADAGVILADSAVPNSTLTLNAPYVALGEPFLPPVSVQFQTPPFVDSEHHPFTFSPTYGAGSLDVNASLIDVGNLSLQMIGSANLDAANGDVRGDGTLDIAGGITITAGQVYPPTAVAFTIAAYDYTSGGQTQPGSVTIIGSGVRQLPLSAGGVLSLYATDINQGGVLRAPIGTINLGWDGVGTAPVDTITGQAVAVTQQLTLSAGSQTSVSAVDPATGKALIIPYGINVNGTEWIDPTGTDITAGGVPSKQINISAVSITDESSATIDISGGGDLYAYRFVSGLGGTQDILASTSSFAVIPGYQAGFAPYGAYNATATNLGGDQGYTNGSLAVGSSVYLQASNGLPAGVYTLLPARYALLPGAFLVTPQGGTPVASSVALPDGSSVVSGYSFNGMNNARTGQPLYSLFQVDPQSVVRSEAEYDNFSANSYLAQSAILNNAAVPRLPMDSGHLVFQATASLSIQGAVNAQTPAGGLGGLVDISSPGDILIGGPGVTAGSGVFLLNSAELSSFNVGSLLIGGIRQIGAAGTTVSVATDNIEVDNAGTPLTGEDIILVANDTLTVDAGAEIEAVGAQTSPAETVLLGNAATPGSGDGVLLRVSNDPSAGISRTGVDQSAVPAMVIDAGARLSGASLILDSTHATSLSPDAVLDAGSVSLDSGQISIQLDNPGNLNATSGLVLSGLALQTLQNSAQALSLLSYSSIDIYGSGQIGSRSVGDLALHASEIRGFNNGGGTVSFAAQNILLDNASGGASPGPVATPQGTLEFDADTIELGVNQLNVDQYASLTLNASGGLLAENAGGLATQGGLAITAPVITGALGAVNTVTAVGAVTIQTPAGGGAATVTGGLGASLSFQGASVTVDSDILAPSGKLTLHATTGDLTIGSRLDAGGAAERFFNIVDYTNGGEITLTSDAGNVNLEAGSTVTVAAQAGGGNAGTLAVSAPAGVFTAAGTVLGQGGAGGQGGSFSLDVGSLPSTSALNATLNTASFSLSRSIRVRTGDVTVDGLATAQTFNVSTDAGSITVSGEIDASGAQGGTIDLEAYGSITLLPGSLLTVAGAGFNDAGEGGSVSLEAGSETNGVFSTSALLNVEAGSTIDLSVAQGVGGTLLLRAPQNAAATDLALAPINGSIVNASSIVVEGYQIFNTTSDNGSIDDQEANVLANGQTFASVTNIAAISSRLLASNANAASLASVLNVEPGAEIINLAGDLTLTNDWDLTTYRFGQQKAVVDNNGNLLFDFNGNQIFSGVEPGILTLRAAGSIIFNGSLNDGFGDGAGIVDIPFNSLGENALYLSPLLPRFQDGTGQKSWSYNITSGADFSAADSQAVLPLGSASFGASGGSILIGQNGYSDISNPPGSSAIVDTAIEGLYQVIRTGAGSINISAGGNVELLNQFATIYTAGVQVADPTMQGTFDLPQLGANPITGQPLYPAQYSFGGGNVTVTAQGDIEHLTQTLQGTVVPDSERELPENWLYRRGYVDNSGQFGVGENGDVESTTWWVDFSNFFEGVGALGGGNVTMIAGQDIDNVDAVAPTNARMPGDVPNAAALVELGGGDVTVKAGNDINGGVYYVERGQGALIAGGQILTNSTRSPSLVGLTQAVPLSEQTWLPTTLFMGDASFDVSAVGNVLLGPVANPFLLPQGIGNSVPYKTYFSTYAPTDTVDVESLTGNVTLREYVQSDSISGPPLDAWLQVQDILPFIGVTGAYYQPWLNTVETNAIPFSDVSALMPGSLSVTALSGDIDIVGDITLAPTPTGTINLVAKGSINALQPDGASDLSTGLTQTWIASTIVLSDASPSLIPGVTSPFAFQSLVSPNDSSFNSTGPNGFLNFLFPESGSIEGFYGLLATRQELHAPGLLHADDPDPVELYAGTGNISGLTLFSGKSADVLAGQDITDIALYIQNDNSSDVSVVASGRDIIPYDPNSVLRVAAQQLPGNQLAVQAPEAGDIQVAGPGTLEVLAGRNLNLGVGPNSADGTAVGITTIGNEANPYLPFAGADIIAAAGLGSSSAGLASSSLDFTDFISKFLNPATGSGEAATYLPDLGGLLGLSGAGNSAVWDAFEKLSAEQQDSLALDVFYLVLRDAGRNHAVASSPGFNNYTAGYAAIAALFPGNQYQGDISLTSREIKTVNGGNISLLAPGGQLTVGIDVPGNQSQDQGILTQDGGNISIFTYDSVNVGTSRIFTLRGGNEILWSTTGNIDAGASSKTVQSAAPTRVLVDPQSANVSTDLAGLATGGGIGVLATVKNIPPGDVDLVAPQGTIDAGDAGIRATGNLNISALRVLNASNIQVGGASVGVPTTSVSAPNLAGLTAASTTAGASTSQADEAARQAASQQQSAPHEMPSIITVEVLGYGGGDDSAE